jgi:hypothetical protein
VGYRSRHLRHTQTQAHNAWRPRVQPPGGYSRMNSTASGSSNVGRLFSLCTVDDLKLDGLTLGQRPETVAFDRGVVDEHILAGLLTNKSEAFRFVEPLNRTFQVRSS